MSIRFRNRISGVTTESPGASPVRGLWQVVRSEGDIAFLNTVPLERIVYLVPDRTNHWDVLVEATGEHIQGMFPASQALDDSDAGGILALGGRLGAMLEANARYREWLTVTPLIPQISKRIQIQPLEEFVEKHLGALEGVCQKPRGHLYREIERVPVARARRIPAYAETYLAAHTEDWERPTLSSVRPKRVLALVQDDQWDIYENRVAARLVDHLRTYFERRLHDLRRIAEMLEFVNNPYDDIAMTMYWRRRERVLEILGNAASADEEHLRARETLDRLTKLHRRIAALLDSFLYSEIPRSATVPATLRQTNIFYSDQRYRRVAHLWKEWAKQKQSRDETSAEVQDKQQRIGQGFAYFCWLLVCRAFEQLKYKPAVLENVLSPSSTCTFDGAYGPIDVEWLDDGTADIRGGQSLRIVPVFASLASSMDDDDLQRQIVEMERAASNHEPTLVLYPSAAHDNVSSILLETRKRLWGLGHEQRSVEARRLGFLPVSPWDIGSVERVARAFRWAILGSWLMNYPKAVGRPPKDLDARLIDGWLDTSDSRESRMLRRPSTLQWQQIETERRIRREAFEKIQAQLDALPPRELGDRRKLSARNRQKCQLNQELNPTQRRAEEMDEFCRHIETGGNFIDTLMSCPICDEPTPVMHNLDRGTFQNECEPCESSWGTLICSSCSNKFPFLRVKSPVASTHEDNVGTVDHRLGRDVLAVPCAHDVFLCPECGTRPCAQCAQKT